MTIYNFFSSLAFFIKKKDLFNFKCANKRKKNLILPLDNNKVKFNTFRNEPLYLFIMHNKHFSYIFLLFALINFGACTSDEMALTLGEDVVNDDHEALFTNDFTIKSETLLSEYVLTNNSGVALCGSYNDDYIGEITTNTVFKISPNINSNDSWYNNSDFSVTAELDSIILVLYTNGYIYGDSTKAMTISLHALTENYLLDTADLTNNTVTPYNPVPICSKTFIPEDLDGDSLVITLPQALAQEWFDSIKASDGDFIIDGNGDDPTKPDNDSRFIENVVPGFTIRSSGNNQAVIGFKMPTSATKDFTNLSTIRMYYSQYPSLELFHDFKIYEPDHQYNQITADFSQGKLAGIVAGGDGIPSTETDGLTFVQSGLGLMTKVEIPTLNELYTFGNNVTILNLDLSFGVLPLSFDEDYPLPTFLNLERFQKNGELNEFGVINFSGSAVSIGKTVTNTRANYSVPITRYGIDEQKFLDMENEYHTALLISPLSQYGGLPTVNRMVIGDADKDDCNMSVSMYYTTFE